VGQSDAAPRPRAPEAWAGIHAASVADMTEPTHRPHPTPDPQPDEEAMGNVERRRGTKRGDDEPGEGVNPERTEQGPPRQTGSGEE